MNRKEINDYVKDTPTYFREGSGSCSECVAKHCGSDLCRGLNERYNELHKSFIDCDFPKNGIFKSIEE
jgi:hypothetical protein